MKKIAIIGFGGAGYSAAREIRRLDPRAVIDVYSDTDTGPYNPIQPHADNLLCEGFPSI